MPELEDEDEAAGEKKSSSTSTDKVADEDVPSIPGKGAPKIEEVS